MSCGMNSTGPAGAAPRTTMVRSAALAAATTSESVDFMPRIIARQSGDSGFGTRDSGFGIRDSGFGIWDLGFEIRSDAIACRITAEPRSHEGERRSRRRDSLHE